jgi:hypothetical protein
MHADIVTSLFFYWFFFGFHAVWHCPIDDGMGKSLDGKDAGRRRRIKIRKVLAVGNGDM